MESGNFSTKINEPVSVLQGDKFFFNRIISRESSVGCSSRFYYRSSEGVPFKWEMQPGKSKNPPPGKEVVVPPIRAPPAALSLGLPKPCIDHQYKAGNSTDQTGSTSRASRKDFRVLFWKKIKLRKKVENSKQTQNYNSDVESSIDLSSPRSSSSSSSSSSFSSSSNINKNGHSLPNSRIQSPARDLIYGPFSCSPWNISGIMICTVAKRV